MPATTRRGFVQSAGAIAAALAAPGAAAAQDAAGGDAARGTSRLPPFRLGIVTYMVAADWDVPTILKVCKSVGITDVELRTTHKHGVEPSLNKQQRQDVRQRFADAGVTLWGLGTTCEFHSPDPSVVAKHIDTCRQFVDLARDVGAKGVKVRHNGLPKEVPPEKTLEPAEVARIVAECVDGNLRHTSGEVIHVHKRLS